MWGLLTLWIRGWADFRALNVQDRLKMIQGISLATLARLFCVPPIKRDRGLNSRIVSCLSSASVIAVPYAISCYSALRYTGTDCMEFWKLFLSSIMSMIRNSMLLPGPVLKAFGWVQISPLHMADKSPMITDQLTAGGSVSQLSQLAKLSPWLTLSTKDITTSFWHYKKLFCFLSNQIMGLYHFSNPIE